MVKKIANAGKNSRAHNQVQNEPVKACETPFLPAWGGKDLNPQIFKKLLPFVLQNSRFLKIINSAGR